MIAFGLEHYRIMVAVVAACVWWVNRETSEDIDRKPDVIAEIVKSSLKTCVPQKLEIEKSDYAARLTDALTPARAKNMDVLIREGVIICLDQRHIPLSKGFLSHDFYGAYYYNNGKPVITVKDKGYANQQAGFLSEKIDRHSGEIVDEIAQNYTKTGIWPGEDQLAYRESKSCGENCKEYYIAWQKMSATKSKSSGDSLNIKKPPLIEGSGGPFYRTPNHW